MFPYVEVYMVSVPSWRWQCKKSCVKYFRYQRISGRLIKKGGNYWRTSTNWRRYYVTPRLSCAGAKCRSKSAIILRLIPESNVTVTQRCSGHGGTWGVLEKNHPVAVEFGRPIIERIILDQRQYFASECPLAGNHLLDGISKYDKYGHSNVERSFHPIQLLAKTYGADIV